MQYFIVVLSTIFLSSFGHTKTPVHEKIVIEGVAGNAKLGAVVITDDSVYYIDGVKSWTDAFNEHKVRVTGRLTIKHNHSDKSSSQVSALLPEKMYVVRKARYHLVE